jgi:hypothetical protein
MHNLHFNNFYECLFQHVTAILLVLWITSVMRKQGSANAEQIHMVGNVISVNLVFGTSPIANVVSAMGMQIYVTLVQEPVAVAEILHLATIVTGDYFVIFILVM